jgi:hypothetical protein
LEQLESIKETSLNVWFAAKAGSTHIPHSTSNEASLCITSSVLNWTYRLVAN